MADLMRLSAGPRRRTAAFGLAGSPLSRDEKIYFSKTLDEWKSQVDQANNAGTAKAVYLLGQRNKEAVLRLEPWSDRERGIYSYYYPQSMIVSGYAEGMSQLAANYGPFDAKTPAAVAAPTPQAGWADRAADAAVAVRDAPVAVIQTAKATYQAAQAVAPVAAPAAASAGTSLWNSMTNLFSGTSPTSSSQPTSTPVPPPAPSSVATPIVQPTATPTTVVPPSTPVSTSTTPDQPSATTSSPSSYSYAPTPPPKEQPFFSTTDQLSILQSIASAGASVGTAFAKGAADKANASAMRPRQPLMQPMVFQRPQSRGPDSTLLIAGIGVAALGGIALILLLRSDDDDDED